MSIKAIGWALEQKTGNPTAKLVLIKLADNANDEGLCWPSIATMMRQTELAERTIQYALKYLEEIGLIRKEDRPGHSNVYYLTKKSYPQAKRGVHQMHPTPAPDAPPGVQEMHPGGAPHAPITVIEPSFEPPSKPTLKKRSLNALELIDKWKREFKPTDFQLAPNGAAKSGGHTSGGGAKKQE